MDDITIRKPELIKLIDELELLWDKKHPTLHNTIHQRESPQVNQFVKGYPIFSGKRDGLKVAVTLENFHTPIIEDNNTKNLFELLCVSVREPKDRFISFLDNEFYKDVIKKKSKDWVTQTGSLDIDKTYFIEARSDDDKKIIKNKSFEVILRKLQPFTSLSIRMSGIYWINPFDKNDTLDINNIELLWEMLTELSRLS